LPEQRLEAALEVGVLRSAVDAAHTAQAKNSLEKMLCHQMAAVHHMGFRVHGGYSQAAKAERAEARRVLRDLRALIARAAV
jgi:hypothetical protein